MTNLTPGSADENPDAQHTEAFPPPPPRATQPGGNQTFMTAVHDQLTVLARLASGKTVEALEVATRSRLLWLVTLLGGAILAGLLVSTTIARVSGAVMSSLSSFFGGSPVYFGISFGAWIGTIAAAVVLVALALGMRVVALHLTFQIAGKPQPFATSMSLTAAAYSIHLPIMAVMLILMLIPGTTWLMLVIAVASFLLIVGSLVAELLVYIGLNRTTQFAGSPLRVHAISTAVWMAAVAIMYVVASMIMGEMGANSLGGML